VATPAPEPSACSHPGHDGQYWLPRDLARQHLAKCPWCGELYDIGPHTGEQHLFYPEAQSRFWQHGTSARHTFVMGAMAHHAADILARIPEALTRARTDQKELQDPTRLAIKRILT